MLTKTEFLALIADEIAILKHLAGKLQPQHLGFRLTPPQRSTQELLEHLATLFSGSVAYFVSGSWDGWEQAAKQAQGVTLAGFPAALDRQLAEVTTLLSGITDGEFAARPSQDVFGKPQPLGAAVLRGTVAWTYGYKMQLFLQAKAAGIADIGTSNLWVGCDRKAES